MTETSPTLLIDTVWQELREAAQAATPRAPALVLPRLAQTLILESATMAQALARTLARQQIDALVTRAQLETLFLATYERRPELIAAAALDLMATTERDPAARSSEMPFSYVAFLYFKGFHAIQTHRIAHILWNEGQREDALYLQSRSSALYGVDIHPAARIGHGLLLDHATGVVIGETAIVGNNVSMLHQVTLGGTGKEQGDRHPKVRDGVLIGASATLLGNIDIGEGACIAAGSVVLESVPAHTTVAGVPARIVGTPRTDIPSLEMDQAASFGDRRE